MKLLIYAYALLVHCVLIQCSSSEIDQTCTIEGDQTCIDASTSVCEDLEPECPDYAANNEDKVCLTDSYYMFSRCRKSCDACSYDSYLAYFHELVQPMMYFECTDDDENCSGWADVGECEINPDYMMDHCRLSCDICIPVFENVDQNLHEDDEETNKALLEHVSNMNTYYEHVLLSDDPKYVKVRNACANINSNCVYWAATGECDLDKHFAFMMANCPLACMSCEMMDIDNRCPMPDSLQDGDFQNESLDSMFERIVKGDYGSSIVVHSAPDHYTSIEGRITRDEDVKLDAPWVVTFEDFLSPEEASQLIVLGYNEGFIRSTDVGSKKADGSYEHTESASRTSENAWCSDDCNDDPIVQKISNRIFNITGIPIPNHENFQILRYEKDQFYESHHDFIEHQLKRPCGPRMLTFFLYLSDVEEGGGTRFTDLDITITPKIGRALLWPSILNNNILEKDFRTHHEALPVIKGTKFAANAWLHLRNFRDWVDRGCV